VLEDWRRALCPECAKTHRWCNRCKSIKPLDDFFRSKNVTGGRTRYCRQCHYEHIRRPEALEARQEYFYRYHLRRKFGISEEEADRLASATHCDCCGAEKDEFRLHVDHNHITGQVRGAVCRLCNYAIGYLEKEDLVEAVRAYLLRYA
jgi:hypothetical protein